MAGLVEERDHLFLEGLTDVQHQLRVLGDVTHCRAQAGRDTVMLTMSVLRAHRRSLPRRAERMYGAERRGSAQAGGTDGRGKEFCF